ncbi:MAG: extracellular solute-binding protein [Eubacteriales bacterium]|nr:extracellular solute-binding protein [Eubacteriales bacterium]
MKRLFASILALTMSLSLAACGNSGGGDAPQSDAADPAGGAEPTKMTLILRGGTYGDVIKGCLPAFEAEHNVKCEVLDLSFDDLHSKIALNAPNPQGEYDLCMVDGSWMAEFTANGVLADLSELGYSFDEDIIPATTDICMVGDDIYLAPYFGNVTVMLYNKQLIADAGYAPEDIDTFADLKDIAQKTNAAGKKGFLVRGGSGDNIVSDFIPHLLAYGGWVVDENNKPTVDTPAFKAAFENYIELYKLGDTMDKDDIVAAIDSGEAALGQGWPGWYVPAADSAANYTVIPTKLDDNDTAKNTSMYGVWTIGVCENSPNKELAVELLKYLMDPEVQLSTIDAGGVPCRYSCLLDEGVLAKYPHLETVCGALESGVYRPVIEEWAEFTNILGTEMDSVIQGVKSMDQGLADAQRALDELMA